MTPPRRGNGRLARICPSLVGASIARPCGLPGRLALPQNSKEGSRPLPTNNWEVRYNGGNANYRQVCRGRIYASRAIYSVSRFAGSSATGGIYAAPTSQPFIFIIIYGRGQGMPRPYRAAKPPQPKTTACSAVAFSYKSINCPRASGCAWLPQRSLPSSAGWSRGGGSRRSAARC